MEKPLKTLTINGQQYKIKGPSTSLSCGDITLSSDINGTIDVVELFRNNQELNNKIEQYCPYLLSSFESGDYLSLGQIKHMTLSANRLSTDPIVVNLDFGNSISAAADAMLWIDASDPVMSSDTNLAVTAADPGITYEIVGESNYQTATHGKKCLFAFTRITQNTVVANKKEY